MQPNDGFGTLLPLETIELEVIFSPKKTRDYKFELNCKSLINRYVPFYIVDSGCNQEIDSISVILFIFIFVKI